MADKIDQLTIGSTSYDIDLPPDATPSIASLTVSGTTNVSAGTLKAKTINIPTSSGGSTYGPGSSGQVLKSNGTTVYWASDSNADHYPTTFTWTNGTTAGPTGSLTGNSGFTAVSFGAIPAAGASQSGIVTTGTQTFGGVKTFKDDVKIGTSNSSDLYFYDDSNAEYIGMNINDRVVSFFDTNSENTLSIKFTSDGNGGNASYIETYVDDYSYAFDFPSKSGTFALTNDLPQIIDLR